MPLDLQRYTFELQREAYLFYRRLLIKTVSYVDAIELNKAFSAFKYPMLANYQDDIRQELWLAIKKHIPQFSPDKSSMNTFCRMVLETALKEIRRFYFTNKSIAARNTSEISPDYDAEFEKNDTLRKIMISDVHAVLNTLSPMHQSICKLLMKGWTVRDIVRYHNLSIPAFYKFHLEKIKQAFVEAGF